MMRLALLASVTALVAACDQPPGHIGSDGVLVLDLEPAPIDKLDILFVVDNSGSMLDQQTALVEAARDALFGQLAADLGGLPDLHVGVTSTAIPITTPSVPGCTQGLGGALTTNGCAGITGSFLVDEDDGAGGRTRNYTGDLADAFGCMAALGVNGCGFEQPLAAAIRAVDGSVPGNAGFLRDDAFLLVVLVTDEDDCSMSDTSLLGDPVADLESALGPRTSFRCFEFGVVCDDDSAPRAGGPRTDCAPREDSAYLTAVATMVDALRAVKADPAHVMVAGIHGGPDGVEVVPDVNQPELPALGTLCPGTDFEVTPGVRLSAFASAFPARWLLTPDCLEATSSKVARISRATAGVLTRRTCLLGATPDAERCAVDIVSPGGARTGVPRCAAGQTEGCYRLEPDAATCGYTDHQLHLAVSPALVPAGDRLQVRCRPAR